MVFGKFGELVFPIFHSVNFTVDENDVGTLALRPIVKVAAIDVDARHDLLIFYRSERPKVR